MAIGQWAVVLRQVQRMFQGGSIAGLTKGQLLDRFVCYREGLTHEEAADRLGWPVGTVKGRLSRAREKLRERLTRRGVALPSVAFSTNLARVASATIPAELFRTTTIASIQLASGKTLT